jgi:dTDP-glucose 4,6-dehydratase
MKNILVTGGLGFIGFNFLKYVNEKYPKYRLICLDSMTYAAKIWLDEKLTFLNKNNIKLYQNNICEDIEYIIKDENIDTIVNFAAESHVDVSISNPSIFTKSNVLGVSNLLEYVRKYDLRFHQIGTDEVYGSVDPEKDYVDENFKLQPSSPYSASKAAADLLTLSYYKTFKSNVTVSRCSNNFGPYQHVEKLLPKVITNAINDKMIPIYGDGKQRRFWIHVNDHNEAVMKILENGKPGEIYNIAPDKNNLKTNIEMVEYILSYLNKNETLIEHVTDRPGHDLCYYLEGDKLETECGFNKRSALQFNQDLIDTIDWYKTH